MKNRFLFLAGALAFLVTANAANVQAQTDSQGREAKTLFAGDLECNTAGTPVALHYAIVPMPAKNEISFYARYSMPLAVQNTITNAAGRTLSSWKGKGDSEQCFSNVPGAFFKGTASAVYTWTTTTEKGAVLSRIVFTAKEALGQ